MQLTFKIAAAFETIVSGTALNLALQPNTT